MAAQRLLDVYIARTGVDAAELDQKFANVDCRALKSLIHPVTLLHFTDQFPFSGKGQRTDWGEKEEPAVSRNGQEMAA